MLSWYCRKYLIICVPYHTMSYCCWEHLKTHIWRLVKLSKLLHMGSLLPLRNSFRYLRRLRCTSVIIPFILLWTCSSCSLLIRICGRNCWIIIFSAKKERLLNRHLLLISLLLQNIWKNWYLITSTFLWILKIILCIWMRRMWIEVLLKRFCLVILRKW